MNTTKVNYVKKTHTHTQTKTPAHELVKSFIYYKFLRRLRACLHRVEGVGGGGCWGREVR